jgi:WD40 repeat protein
MALAEDGSPDAVKVLAQGVTRLEDEEILAIVIEALSQLRKPACIDSVCQVWATTRHQKLANLLVKKGWVASAPVEVKVLTALKTGQLRVVTGGGKEIVEPLLGAFKDKDSEIASRASQSAVALTNPDAIDYLCQQWAKTRDKLLEQVLCQGKYVARQPIELRVLTALKLEQLESIKQEGAEVLKLLLQLYKDSDRIIAQNAQLALKDLLRKNSEAQDLLFRLASEQNDRVALEIAITFKYAPREPSQRALFYFLTEQWDEYESLDYERTLLQKIYELGDEKLRKSIADKAKQAGRVEWVGVVAGGRKGQRLGAMTDAEWETTLAVLNNGKQWEEMYKLAQKAPAIWSKQLLEKLKQVAWLPTVDQERVGFERLKQLVQTCLEKIPPMATLMRCQTTLTGHTDTVWGVTFSPDGRLLVSCSSDKTIRLWQMPDGKPLATLTGHTDTVLRVTFSPDGQLLASCSGDKTIRLWQMPDGKPLATLIGHTAWVYGISFSPDGRLLASCSDDKTIRLWQMPDGKPLVTLTGHTAPVRGVSFSPDGRLLASCSLDKTIRLWQMPDGKHLATLSGHTDSVDGVSFSPDGRLLASYSWDKTIRLWQMPDGKPLATLTRHTDSVYDAIFSPDGRLLASCGADRTIRLWQMPDGKPLATLTGHTPILSSVWGAGGLISFGGSVWGVSFSPDGRLLTSCSSDNTIRLWTSDLSRLCSLPIGQLSQQDREFIQEALQNNKILEEERHWLEFMQELSNWHRRFDVEVEDAPRLVSTEEFDIEIEG